MWGEDRSAAIDDQEKENRPYYHHNILHQSHCNLLSGDGPVWTHFFPYIQKYNCIQTTSFGATNIIDVNFMPIENVISISNFAAMDDC